MRIQDIIILVIFIFSFLLMGYFLYSYLLNNRLNNKKKFLRVAPRKNVYSNRLKTTSTLCVLVFASFIISLNVRAQSNIILPFESASEYDSLISTTYANNNLEEVETLARSAYNHLGSNVENSTEKQVLESPNYIYLLEDSSLLIVPLKKLNNTDSLVRFTYEEVLEEKKILISDEVLILYGNTITNSSVIYIHNSSTLEVIEKIIVKGRIACLTVESNKLKVLVKSDISKVKDNLLMHFSVKGVDTLYDYKNSSYVSKGSLCKALSIVKIDLSNFSVKFETIYLSEVYLALDERYVYLFCNLNNPKNTLMKSLLIMYDTDKMKVSNVKGFFGRAYSSVQITEDDKLLASVASLENDSYQYTCMLLDKKLKLLEVNSFELSDVELLGVTPYFMYKAVENQTGLEIVAFNSTSQKEYNIPYSDNILKCCKLIDGKIISLKAIDNKLYLDSYLSSVEKENIELYASNNKINDFKIVNLLEEDNLIKVIFVTDEAKGCLYFSLGEKLELVSKSLVSKDDFDEVIFSSNYTILKTGENIEIINNE